jgi:signal recognition particle GTPase
MVLAELGASLRDSLRKLNSGVSVSEEQVQEVLNDISRALIEADVSVKVSYDN